MATGRQRRATASRHRALELASAGTTSPRRSGVAPWIVAALVAVLVFTGVTVGYVWMSRSSCRGQATPLSIVASPDQYDVVRSQAEKWQKTEPSVDGRCARITVSKQASHTVASALSSTWDESRGQVARPDVWMPDSSAWILAASSRPDAAPLVSGARTSVASSPVVMAVPRPMAELLGWPNRQVGWFDLVGAHFKNQTWAHFQRPEWGPIKIGMDDPTRSTAGLLGLIPLSDSNGDNRVELDDAKGLLVFSRAVAERATDSNVYFDKLRKAQNQIAALRTVSAFPALERDVVSYNAEHRAVQLVPIYPAEGTTFADYPYTVLNAPWVDSFRKNVAAQFLKFLRTRSAERSYGDVGFRTPSRSVQYARQLYTQAGISDQIGQVARPVTSPTTVVRTIVYWTALERTTTFLALIDTSGSMAETLGNQTKMQLVQDAAIKAISLFADDSHVGLWQFATNLDGAKDYRQVFPLLRVGDKAPDGKTWRTLGAQKVLGFKPGGQTGLYDSVLAAYQYMQKNWQPRQLNLLVVLTDGQNDDPGSISRPDLLARLRQLSNPDRPVQIITLGIGNGIDTTELRQIAGVTGGRSYQANDAADMERLWLATILGDDPVRTN
jgi:Ca-activated chloride channel family protein